MRGKLAFLLAALICLPSLAWRETGHFTVCEIAYHHLDAVAKARVDELTGGPDRFATQCTWPDMIRKSAEWGHSYNWHFVDRDDGIGYFDPKHFAPTEGADGDAVRALVRAERMLRSALSSPAEKRSYLRFLGHLVGDIHQPLHAGRHSDGGGNFGEFAKISWFGMTKTTYPEILRYEGKPAGVKPFKDEATGELVYVYGGDKETGVNLHKVWDLHLLEKFLEKESLPAVPGDSKYRHKAYARAIDTAEPSPATLAVWQASTYWDWYRESYEARGLAYDIGAGKLDEAYYRKTIKVVNQRLLQAGYRLAGTLNRVLGEDHALDERTAVRRRLVGRAASLAEQAAHEKSPEHRAKLERKLKAAVEKLEKTQP